MWQANLKTLSVYAKDISKTLPPEEVERANKLKFTRDREQFILRRYHLRLILSKYCGCQPYEIMFSYNSCKKPFIFIPEFKEIKFNLSYSKELMLVGLSKHDDIGIDIEKINDIRDLENVAIENFSLQELKLYNSKLDKTDTFFKIWTRKEAFIKAKGKGLYQPLKSFCVDIGPSGSHEYLVIFNHPLDSKLWRTVGLDTFDGYIASMAIKSDRFSISYFQL